MLTRVKKMWDEYRHMNYLKLHGGVDPCVALRTRIAEVEKENERLSYNMSVFVKSYRATRKNLAEVEKERDGLKEELEATDRLCDIYFEIAADEIGEDAVRERRDEAIELLCGEE